MKKLLLFLSLSIIVFMGSCKKDGGLGSVELKPITETIKADTLKTIESLQTKTSQYDGESFIFTAEAGSDVTESLQAALNNYKIVYITKPYVISNSISPQSKGSLIGINDAALIASTNTNGLLKSRGVYIDLRNKRYAKIAGVTFKPAVNMLDMARYGNAVILLTNSSNCTIDGNIFDFKFEYAKGMDAIWVTTASNSNVISNNLVKTLGITYCENGSSNNLVKKNHLINSSSNALGGIGNGSEFCYNNEVIDNYIENAGRMGIEDQQKTSGSIIKGNVVIGSGKIPNLGAGLGMGISAVATNSIVENNKVVDAKSYYIEIRGNSNMKAINNEIIDGGTQRGIFVNFVGKSSSPLANLQTLIQGNKITGCLKGIETFGDGTTQLVTIIKNDIINPSFQGINIDLRGLSSSSISILENKIVYNVKSNTSRHGIVTYTTVPSGQQNTKMLINKNNITYNTPSIGGSGYDISLIVQVDKATVSYNTINGYAGGLNYGITNNGAKTTGVTFLGNIVNRSIWNIAQFPS